MHGRPASRPDLALACRLPWPGLHSVRQRFPHSLLQPPLRSAPCYATSTAAFLPELTVTSSPRLLLLAGLLLVSPGPHRPPDLQSSSHADSSMLGQRQEPLRHMDGALLLASLVRPGLVCAALWNV
ncbi:hypothetical protein SEVIR_9G553700v4 [Setaria viridis]|uniref:Uncharacterized protein n=2 Tax=Setaria TaxID=4554 RepID=A0A368SW41_SETIT|nr:hypothetical protein SETIT_9G549000v2 [Setaria italica]TKV98333.1 hypothetical protein SEVIR_9G553700v2 [Setaria viridis]